MSVSVPITVAEKLAAVELASEPIDEVGLAGQLNALVPKETKLSDAGLRGCHATIVGLNFHTSNSPEAEPWGMYFVPVSSLSYENGDIAHVPDAGKIDREVIEHWIAQARRTPHPILKARYADLAWELARFWNRTHSGEPSRIAIEQETARHAIDGYLQAVESGIAESEHQAWRFLKRALDLAASIRDDERLGRAKGLAFVLHRQQGVKDSGSSWWKLDDLIWDRKQPQLTAAEQEEVIASLQAALERYSDFDDPNRFDPHQALEAAERLIRRFRKESRSKEAIEALRTAGAAFEKIAEKAAALTATAWLQTLLTRYRELGLTQDAARVEKGIRDRSAEMQASLKRIEIPVDIKPDEFERWLEEITAGNIELAFARIASNTMTSEERVRDMLETTAANAPLHAHLNIDILGPGGFTAARVGSVKDDLPGRMLHQTAEIIGISAPWLHAALDRAKLKHGLNSQKVCDFLAQCPFFSQDTAGLLKEGVDAWFAGDFVKAISVLVPQVEAALREVMRILGESVMRPSRDGGGFDAIPMGTVLRSKAFETQFNPTARLHLRALYTEPKGINLRNRLAHGLAGPELFGAAMANWVIHSLLLVGSMRTRERKG